MPTEDTVSELYMATAAGIATRFTAQRPELRDSSGVKHIAGYASVFGKRSRNLGGFVEQIDRRAFDQAELSGWADVVCRYNHDDNYLLGTTRGNTLQLRTDDTGLWYDVVPPSFRADIIELCARGDVTQSSFAFRVPDDGDYWERSGPGGMPLRTVTATELVDVAPVNNPAYTDATASARSFDDDLIMSLARLKECSPTEVRSYLNEAGNVAKFFKRSDRPSAPVTEEHEMTATDEERAKLSSGAMNDLPDSAFAYIEPGGTVVDGKTEPRSLRHFPIHDEAHIRNALSRAPQSPFGPKAMPKIKAAAKAHGIEVTEQKSLMLDGLEEFRIMLADMFDEDEEMRGDLPPWLQKAKDAKDKADGKSDDDDEDDDDDKSDSKKAPKTEKKSEEEDAEARAKEGAPMNGKGDSPAEDDDEDEDDDDAPSGADDKEARTAAIEAEHQEMLDRLRRHAAFDMDLDDLE
jgi:HK97 family phage prohead protease